MRIIIEKLFPSLGKKVAFAVVLVFLTAGGAFVYLAHQTGYTMLQKQARAKAHGVAEFGKAILEHIMLGGRNDHLQAALRRAVASGQAKDFLILTIDGTIILKADSKQYVDRLPIEKFVELPQFPGDRFLSIKQNDSLYEFIVTPIQKKPECYNCHPEKESTKGFLAVNISMDDVREASLEHRTINLVMTFITFSGLGIILYLALMFLVIRPVKKLSRQMVDVEEQIEKYEEGKQVQFSELELPRSKDEITGLLTAFNKLIRRLNKTHNKLHEMHQSQLEHADRLATTGEMAAGIAHEIKNPIAGVLGALQVFDSETPPDNDRKEIIAEMISQLERVDHTVNDLLSYARPTLPVFEQADVNELIKKTISLLSQQIKHKQIEITTDSTGGEMKIQADRKQLQQVLWNIMLNAVQSIDYRGHVMINVAMVNVVLKISVKDTGKGITSDQLINVFQPFFTTKHKGTGLGMTISKRIIEQHQGSIGIESHAGRGTTVTITLPIQQHQK